MSTHKYNTNAKIYVPKAKTYNIRKPPSAPPAPKAAVQRAPRGRKPRDPRPAVVTTVAMLGKTDARLARPTTTGRMVSSQTTSTILDLVMDEKSLQAFMIAFVSQALARGYLGVANAPAYPFLAYNYGYKGLVNAALGATQTVTSAPYWYVALCQALSPKAVGQLGGGSISFKWSCVPTTATWNFPISPTSYGFEWLLGVVGTGEVDLFPKITDPGSYSEQEGAKAWMSICEFMNRKVTTGSAAADTPAAKNNQVVPMSTKTSMMRDASTFAFSNNPEGWGAVGVGGWASMINFEGKLRSPVLGMISTSDVVSETYSGKRYPRKAQSWSGDATFAGLFLSYLSEERCWTAKRPPIFGFTDFNMFGTVLARWVAKLQAQRYKDTNGQNSIKDINQYVLDITLQEMLLVLRNEIMFAFGDTQPGVQSIYPRIPAADTSNEFVPFTAGTNTVALTSLGMKLPIMFAENIKALIARVAYARSNKKVQYDPQWYIPVLGINHGDRLNKANYSYEAYSLEHEGDPTVVYSFSDEPTTYRKRKDSKGAVSWVGDTEAVISLVDGTSASSSYFINDTTRLKQLCGKWNTWLEAVSCYTDSLVVLGKDPGSPALCSISMMMIWAPPSATFKERHREVVDRRFEASKYHSTPYADRQIYSIISHGDVLAAPFEQVLSQWILPTMLLDTNGGPAALTTLSRIQSISGMTNTVVQSATGESAVLLDDFFDSYASKMVKQRGADKSDVTRFLEQEAASGHGGILSGIAADLIGGIFGSAAGKVAKTVASILPV